MPSNGAHGCHLKLVSETNPIINSSISVSPSTMVGWKFFGPSLQQNSSLTAENCKKTIICSLWTVSQGCQANEETFV